MAIDPPDQIACTECGLVFTQDTGHEDHAMHNMCPRCNTVTEPE
jgi:phage FluMu protein Com